MKKTYENQRGLTLIALIVSILVILILIGTPIIMLSGNNNIIDFSLKSRKSTILATIEEYVRNASLAAAADGKGEIKQSALERELGIYLGKRGFEYDLTGNREAGWTVTIPSEQASFNIDSEGNIELVDIIDNSGSFVLALVDDLGTRSTIYLYNNTDKITSGSISITNPDSTTSTITAIDDTSEITDSANYATYTVSKNGTYTFTASADGQTTETKVNITNIEKFTKVDDLNLSYVNNQNKAYKYKGAAVPKGYYLDTKSNVETGLVITDSIDSEGYSIGNEWVWIPVNRLVGNNEYYLTGSGTMNGTETVGYTRYGKLYSFVDKARENYGTFHSYGTNTGVLSMPSSTSGYREPAILTSESYGEAANLGSINKRGTNTQFTEEEGVDAVATQYVTDFENMCYSVDTYGGFYIGRYELTSNGEKPGASLTGKGWYSHYNQCLTYGTDYTESGMIYGCLWDATMQWLAKSNYSVGYTGNTYSGYGNYVSEAVIVNNNDTTIAVKAMGTSQKLSTGKTSYTNINNIFDLAGNCFDSTMEVFSTGNRVYRGGRWTSYQKTTNYASCRLTASEVNAYLSSRPCLYIK